MKSFRIYLMLIAAAVTVAIPRALSAEMQGVVLGDRVIIRSKPGQPYERLGTFLRGEVVTVVKEENGWYAVQLPPSICGWVTQDQLDENNIVKNDTCLMYAGASFDFTAFYQIPQGTKLEIVARNGEEWLKVQSPAGATAWVSKEFIGPWSEKIQQEQAAKEAAEAKAKAEAEKLAAMQEEAKRLQEANEVIRKELEQAKAEQEKLLAEKQQEQENLEKIKSEQAEQADAPGTAENTVTQAEKTIPAADSEGTVQPPPEDNTEKPAQDSSEKPAQDSSERQTLVIAVTPEQSEEPAETEESPSENTVEMPEDTELNAVIPPAPVETIRGTIISLGRRSNSKATHVLCDRKDFTFIPKMYLRSDLIELKDWEQLEVMISGNEENIPNWRLPVLDVRFVMRIRE